MEIDLGDLERKLDLILTLRAEEMGASLVKEALASMTPTQKQKLLQRVLVEVEARMASKGREWVDAQIRDRMEGDARTLFRAAWDAHVRALPQMMTEALPAAITKHLPAVLDRLVPVALTEIVRAKLVEILGPSGVKLVLR